MIQDLKDLQKLLKLCRAQGVTEIKVSGVELKFGDLPQALSESPEIPAYQDPKTQYSNFPQGTLSPSQLVFYSAGGRPEDDPELADEAM